MVADLLGPLDLFVTANAYVRDLLREVYQVVHPVTLVPPERRIPLDGTGCARPWPGVRRGGTWSLAKVAAYLEGEGLVGRFRREFGLATLALDAPVPVDSGPQSST